MKSKKIVRIVCLMFLLFSTSIRAEGVKIEDTGWRKSDGKRVGFEEFTLTSRSITIRRESSPPYQFRYKYLNEDKEREAFENKYPGKIFPCIITGGVAPADSGLGLGGSSWYTHSFMGVTINRKRLNRVLVKEVKVIDNKVELIWQPSWSFIKATFIALPGEDCLYLEITIDPKEEVKSLSIHFACSPGHYGIYTKKKIDRWISTSKRSIQHDPEKIAILDPQTEPWIFYFDTQNNRRGTGALFYLPEEVKEVKVNMPGSTIITSISYPPSTRKMHFIIYNFPDNYKKPEDAYRYLKENGMELLGKLRKVR